MSSSAGSRMTLLSTFGAVILVLVLLAAENDARPSGRISRQKRVSDQRLAELETLLALERIRGQLVTVPVAFGRVDPAKIGRRRRSSVEGGFERLQRILQAAAQDSQSVGQESDESASSIWDDIQDRREEETEDQFI
ncbi:uncharacterized protein LOC105690530 [Athalia rosae]|uniref:uncharacterized protein LOC105690530 n=1 Tax=Athalia rosae TaxID=37344 RepID=UPI0006251C55|nr:uncharacterized protein LOC105690530 [Athalia rosae]